MSRLDVDKIVTRAHQCKMPLLHLGRVLDSNGEAAHEITSNRVHKHSACAGDIFITASGRLSTRCRATGPFKLDTAPLDSRGLSGATVGKPTKRDEAVHATVRQDVPLLGVCRRFSFMDERRQRAESQQQAGIWTMDVRGA